MQTEECNTLARYCQHLSTQVVAVADAEPDLFCVQALASQFEQLALGPGQNPTPGQPPDSGADIAGFPRPLGADAAAGDAPPTVDPHSCDPAYLRPTTTVFPGTQTIRARCVRFDQQPATGQPIQA